MFSRWSFLVLICLAGQLMSSALGQAQPEAAHVAMQADKQSMPLAGIWLGTLRDGNQVLHLRLEIKTDTAGPARYILYSLDQGGQPVPCHNVQLKGKELSFEVPEVNGHWSGQVSPDKQKLSGTWDQGKPLALDFLRQH